jgi:two-component system, OmpR family, response regulator QseB
MNILMIEDDLDLGRGLVATLKGQAIGCQWIRRAAQAPDSFTELDCDCVLLDLSLPDGEGHDLLARWRRNGVKVPVVIMTARSRLEDKLAGLDGGADDFLVKPFAPAELISRLRAVVRRAAQQASETWSLGPLEIEPAAHSIRLNGQPIELTPREFAVLRELARAPGTVVSKEKLCKRLSPLGEPLDTSVIEVHVFNLRRKIGADLIHTVRGVGYLLAT